MAERIIFFGPFRTTTKDMKSHEYHLRNMSCFTKFIKKDIQRSTSPIIKENYKRQLFIKDRNEQKLIDQNQGDEISNRLTFRQDPISQRKIFKIANNTRLDKSLMPLEEEKRTFKKIFQSSERVYQDHSPDANKGKRRLDLQQYKKKIKQLIKNSFIKSKRQYELAQNSFNIKELLSEIPIYDSRVQYKLYTPLLQRVEIEHFPCIGSNRYQQ